MRVPSPRIIVLTTSVIVTLLGGAAISAVGARAASSSVSVVDFSFQPSSTTVQVGTTVQWTNNGIYHHEVVNDTGSAEAWTADLPNNGSTGSHTFNQVGSFSYHCSIHPYMQGTINVVALGGATNTPVPTAAPTSTPLPTSIPVPSAVPTSTHVASVPTATSTTVPPATSTVVPSSTPAQTTVVASPNLVASASGSLRVGHSSDLTVTVRAKSSQKPVSGSGVVLDGRAVGIKRKLSGATGSKGKATFKHLHPTKTGRIRITITKPGWRGTQIDVKVKS